MPKRLGTQKDKEALIKSGETLGFEVKAYDNLKAGELREIIFECKCLKQWWLFCEYLAKLSMMRKNYNTIFGKTKNITAYLKA